MNVLFIPSWYPSVTDPLPGIFFKDQAVALTRQFKELNIGISTWGQNDERLLLWSGQLFQSLNKLLFQEKPKSSKNTTNDNLVEYFSPAYTWSSKVFHGNFKQIIESNLSNLTMFQRAFGKVDIIHAHVGFPGGYIAKKLSKMYKIPYVITEQMSPFPHENFIHTDGSPDKKLIAAYAGSSMNIAISEASASKMKKYKIQRIKKIPNLVDDAMFQSSLPDAENLTFTFFTLGRMVPQKGIDVLLKAFSKMEKNAVLKIGGDGDYLREYKNLARELLIENKIEWLGALNRNQSMDEFRNCDAFVLPSRHESMGVVFAEAMACGKPVIGTVCGGPEEFINDSNGYLIEPENENMLMDAMVSMIQNRDGFDSAQIRKQCADQFSSKVICNQIMDGYQQVLECDSQN